MKSSFPKFLDHYNKAPEEVRRIIDGPSIPNVVDDFIKKYPNLRPLGSELVDLIADVVLNIIGTRAMEEILRTDDKFKGIYSKELVEEIETFVKSVRSSTKETSVADTSSDQTTPSAQELTVKPLRTFSEDAHNVHGYGSFRQNLETDIDTPIHHSEQSSVLPPRDKDDTNGLN